MAYIASSRGQAHRLDVHQDSAGLHVHLDDREVPVDVLQVGPSLYSLLIDGRSYEIDVLEMDGAFVVLVNGQPFRVEIQRGRAGRVRPRTRTAAVPAGEQHISAPMPGRVVKLLVKVGEGVQEGDGIVVVEAMKMENELKASAAGTIREIRTQEGKTVNGGDVLVVIA